MKKTITLLLLVLSTFCYAADNVVPNKLVQLIIDSDELSPYWREDTPDRVPLKIVQQNIGSSGWYKKIW